MSEALDTIRAFRVTALDRAPELLDMPRPIPAKGEVSIRIAACGLNFADLLMARGEYQDTPGLPFTLGMEVCGTVIGHGPGVAAPPLGARVAVFGGQGGLAEEGVFPAALCRPVPEAMPDSVAAAFQVAYGTSHLALTRRAGLGQAERLAVLGAAGGVGLTAVEIGAALGAEVIAVARGPEKLDIARAAGAHHLIDAQAGDLTDRLRALGGADVIYDPVGGGAFRAALRACNPEARALVIGFASGEVPQIPANILLVKNIAVIGFYWGAYLRFAPEALGGSLAELMRWYEDGRLRPHVSHVLPLDRAQEGLDLLASRRATGKVVIVP